MAPGELLESRLEAWMDEAVKTVVRRYFEAVNGGDEAALDALVADGYVQHSPGAAPGRETVKRHLAMFRSGFPDIRCQVEALLSEGDDVVARTVTEGTHTGEFMGHPPTGRRFRAGGVDIFRVREGRLVEHWGVFDTLGMLLQLGLYRPVPPGAGR
jgi:steroid delta-isomerase-like uncharacterized protein